MTVTITLERGPHRGRLAARLKRAGTAVATLAQRAVKPHRLALAKLGEMPLFLLGTSGVDFAAFHLNHGVGWLVTGLSLILIEHMAADE